MGIFLVLRRRDVALLWSAALISQMGDWVLITALPFYVYTATGSTLASGATFLAGNLPGIALGSVAGVFVDRWDRKRTIVFGALLQGVFLLPLLMVHSTGTLWIVYVVAVVESTIGQFSGPAFQAAVPNVAGAEHLISANSALSVANNVARLTGPSLAGLLMAFVGLRGVVLLDAITFFVEGTLLMLIAPPLQEVKRVMEAMSGRMQLSLAKTWQQWLEGLRLVAGERWITALFAASAISILGDGMFTALLAPFVKDVIGGTALVFGWILTIRGLGGLVGGLTLSTVSAYVRPVRMIGPCCLVMGTLQLLMVGLPSIVTTAAVMFLGGIAAIGVFVNTSTLLQSGIPDHYRGRVFAAYSASLSLAVVCGNVIGGVLGDVVGIRPMVGLGAALSLLAGLVAVTLLRGATAVAAQTGTLLPGAEVST
jgi:MFS family permease